MLAISLWQPWASAWIAGIKIHETRHWRPPARVLFERTIAVHAAKKLVTDVPPLLDGILTQRFGADWRNTLPRGAFVGQLDLGTIHQVGPLFRKGLSAQELALGDYADGRFAWEGRNRKPWEPLPFSGRQGFFAITNDTMCAAKYQEAA